MVTAYSPVDDVAGNILHIVGIMRNMSDTMEREDDLREAAENICLPTRTNSRLLVQASPGRA